MENKDVEFGYLKEHSDGTKNHDSDTGLSKTRLDQYLEIIFPGVEFICDKPMGGEDKTYSRKRPDNRNDDLMLIVEFDGLQHCADPKRIMTDRKNTEIYNNLGYKVVRIPYFFN